MARWIPDQKFGAGMSIGGVVTAISAVLDERFNIDLLPAELQLLTLTLMGLAWYWMPNSKRITEDEFFATRAIPPELATRDTQT